MTISRTFPVRRFGRGFTIIEMLVVMGIIAVLMGTSIIALSRFTKMARRARTQELVANCATALQFLQQRRNGLWPPALLQACATGDGRLDKDAVVGFANADTAKKAFSDEYLGIAFVGRQDVDGSWIVRVDPLGPERCGIVDAEAAAVLKRNPSAQADAAVPTGGTVQDHVLHFSLDVDDKGYVQANVGGKTVNVRGSVAVWSCGPDGKVDAYGSRPVTDDVFSWRKEQEK